MTRCKPTLNYLFISETTSSHFFRLAFYTHAINLRRMVVPLHKGDSVGVGRGGGVGGGGGEEAGRGGEEEEEEEEAILPDCTFTDAPLVSI